VETLSRCQAHADGAAPLEDDARDASIGAKGEVRAATGPGQAGERDRLADPVDGVQRQGAGTDRAGRIVVTDGRFAGTLARAEERVVDRRQLVPSAAADRDGNQGFLATREYPRRREIGAVSGPFGASLGSI
jgi:hypothetical protein